MHKSISCSVSCSVGSSSMRSSLWCSMTERHSDTFRHIETIASHCLPLQGVPLAGLSSVESGLQTLPELQRLVSSVQCICFWVTFTSIAAIVETIDSSAIACLSCYPVFCTYTSAALPFMSALQTQNSMANTATHTSDTTQTLNSSFFRQQSR